MGKSAIYLLTTPFDYHFFTSMDRAELFSSYEDKKMAWWMVRDKRGRFLLAWYSYIVRKMEKIHNKLSIILQNLTCFFFNPHFILVHLLCEIPHCEAFITPYSDSFWAQVLVFPLGFVRHDRRKILNSVTKYPEDTKFCHDHDDKQDMKQIFFIVIYISSCL